MRCLLVIVFIASCSGFQVGFPVHTARHVHVLRRHGQNCNSVARPQRAIAVGRRLGMAPKMMWGFLPSGEEMREGLPPPPVIEISTEDELESLLTRGRFVNKLVVVDWYASWCRTCFFLEPRFQKLARSLLDECIFVKVDGLVLEYNDGKAGPGGLKKRVGVSKYPTFQVWKERVLVAEIIGGDFEPRQFEKNLQGLIDMWLERKAEPLRMVGVGATKKAFDGNIEGGGGWNTGGEGGKGHGGSRSAES
mmetsp:Transcript_6180/g.12505  ORF Transcript_6180/g.12505 Transcript_6180/m.12505 type:complete len:249 (-) Transcript_6180:4-750(-)